MRLVFYLDAGSHIGLGHLHRCLAIADATQIQTHFIIGTSQEDFIRGFMQGRSCSFVKAIHQGQPIDQIQQCHVILNSASLNFCDSILFIDHYCVGLEFEQEAKKFCKFVVVLDDLQRSHKADILIDYFSQANEAQLKIFNSNQGKILSGKDFVIVKKSFRDRQFSRMSNANHRVLLYLGSADWGVYSRLIEIFLNASELSHLSLVVLFSQSPVYSKSWDRERLSFVKSVQDMADFYLNFDWVLGAAGVSMLERIVQKVPCCNFVVVDNQLGAGRHVVSDGLHSFGGDLRHLNNSDIEETLVTYSRSLATGNRQEMLCRCGIDGNGADRIAQELTWHSSELHQGLQE